MSTRRIVGCMTGTSMDGLDVALVEVAGHGRGMAPRFVRGGSRSYPAELQHALRLLAADDVPCATARQFCDRVDAVNAIHESAIREVLDGVSADLLVIHGQTIHHAPPQSWQLAAPTPLARAFGSPLVYDLRAADLAAGGQGAPITPLADFVLFRHAAERRLIINLGGFANFTFLPPAGDNADLAAVAEQICGGDLCVCNQLLDTLARLRLGAAFDEDGRAAVAGQISKPEFENLCGRLGGQAAAGRSLGTQDQQLQWLADYGTGLSPPDALRTAVEAIASVIVAHAPAAERVLLAGGGARNPVLVAAIGRAAKSRGATTVSTTGQQGVPIEFREAVCMAILGTLCADRVPITLPRITGLRSAAPLAGCWIFPDNIDPAAVFSSRPS